MNDKSSIALIKPPDLTDIFGETSRGKQRKPISLIEPPPLSEFADNSRSKSLSSSLSHSRSGRPLAEDNKDNPFENLATRAPNPNEIQPFPSVSQQHSRSRGSSRGGIGLTSGTGVGLPGRLGGIGITSGFGVGAPGIGGMGNPVGGTGGGIGITSGVGVGLPLGLGNVGVSRGLGIGAPGIGGLGGSRGLFGIGGGTGVNLPMGLGNIGITSGLGIGKR